MKVGFILGANASRWLGGYNYIKNLVSAILSAKIKDLTPVILTGVQPETFKQDFPGVDIVSDRLLNLDGLHWKASKVIQSVVGRDYRIEGLLKDCEISLLSHSGHLGEKSSIRTLGWIPDFQHLHVPELFSSSELADRDRRFRRLCRTNTGLVVSSTNALRDMSNFFPEAVGRTHVLRFVSSLATVRSDNAQEAAVFDKYGLPDKYFHVPNQFWVHKNHSVIIEALSVLKKTGHVVTVCFTGSMSDRRQIGYFNSLLQKVEGYGIAEMVKFLGVVPYDDVISIQKNSVAMINPSLFEGWSSSVEEAKSLGKSIILSNIDVHYEQNPQRGIYFDRKDPLALAGAMLNLWDSFDAEKDAEFQRIASMLVPSRIDEFANDYRSIVSKVLGAL